MSIKFSILGKPGWDNGLIAWINSGTRVYRLLFDCGENILKNLTLRDVKSIDYLFFSHFHIDHIAGFDYFFRRNYDREKKPVYIFGPEDTIELLQNRMRSFKWNLVKNVPGLWYISEIRDTKITTVLLKTSDAYTIRHPVEKKTFNEIIIDNPDFLVKVLFLNHKITSAAYYVREKPSIKISKEALKESRLPQGPWLEKIRDLSYNSVAGILLNGKSYKIKELRYLLLKKTEGESIGYLTDFIYDKDSETKIKEVFRNCGTMVCESQYNSEDKDYADINHHLTSRQAASLAKKSEVKKLILFHISDRYKIKEYPSLLYEAREIFPETYLPAEWKIKY
jgi:ribonuclease Z